MRRNCDDILGRQPPHSPPRGNHPATLKNYRLETKKFSNVSFNSLLVRFFIRGSTPSITRRYILASGGEVVTSPPLNRKVGCSRPTMIRARSLRVKQHYPAQKNNQKKHVVLKQGHNSCTALVLVLSPVDKWS